MCEYASTTLNMIECVVVNLKKQSSEYARILNVSDARFVASTSINIWSKTQEKEAPQGSILEFFLLDPLKTTL